MGGGSTNPVFPMIGHGIVRTVEEVERHKYELFLAATLATPLGWWLRGSAGVGSVLFWKGRQLGLLLGLDYSSGGGGPGESPTSTDLHKRGQPVPVVVPAASNSAHGGRRSGSKPRKQKCPDGHYWDHKRKKCRPMRDLVDWEAREAYRRDWYGYRRKG